MCEDGRNKGHRGREGERDRQTGRDRDSESIHLIHVTTTAMYLSYSQNAPV